MSDEIKIESGVPVPQRWHQHKILYPFRTMEVEDSFFTAFDGDARKIFGRISCAASLFGRRNDSKFTCRTVDGGVRCWRIK